MFSLQRERQLGFLILISFYKLFLGARYKQR